MDNRPLISTGTAILGGVGFFAILGLALAIMGFAAAFAVGEAADDGAVENAADAIAGVPALLVALLPFMAAPVLALGAGAWAGHATRDWRAGGIAGALAGLLGPIVMLILVGIGFALGAGAATLNLEAVRMPFDIGFTPGWGDTLPFLASGGGLLWLLSTLLAGGLTGAMTGMLVERYTTSRADRNVRARRPARDRAI